MFRVSVTNSTNVPYPYKVNSKMVTGTPISSLSPSLVVVFITFSLLDKLSKSPVLHQKKYGKFGDFKSQKPDSPLQNVNQKKHSLGCTFLYRNLSYVLTGFGSKKMMYVIS